MAEEGIRKIMRIGIRILGKTGKAGLSERFSRWVENTVRYVANQAGFSMHEEEDLRNTISSRLEEKWKG